MQEEPAVPASLQQVRGRATLNTAAQNPKCRYNALGSMTSDIFILRTKRSAFVGCVATLG